MHFQIINAHRVSSRPSNPPRSCEQRATLLLGRRLRHRERAAQHADANTSELCLRRALTHAAIDLVARLLSTVGKRRTADGAAQQPTRAVALRDGLFILSCRARDTGTSIDGWRARVAIGIGRTAAVLAATACARQEDQQDQRSNPFHDARRLHASRRSSRPDLMQTCGSRRRHDRDTHVSARPRSPRCALFVAVLSTPGQ